MTLDEIIAAHEVEVTWDGDRFRRMVSVTAARAIAEAWAAEISGNSLASPPATADTPRTAMKNDHSTNIPPLPRAAEGHVGRRYPVSAAYDRAEASLPTPAGVRGLTAEEQRARDLALAPQLRSAAQPDYSRAPHIPPAQEPIDTYPGSTWLGTGCFAILGGLLIASAIVAVYRWLGEVTQ